MSDWKPGPALGTWEKDPNYSGPPLIPIFQSRPARLLRNYPAEELATGDTCSVKRTPAGYNLINDGFYCFDDAAKLGIDFALI